MYRPVEKSCLSKFQDLFAALKDVLCPHTPDEDDDTEHLEPDENQQLLPGAGVESQHQQKASQFLLLYSQCLSSFVLCFSHATKEKGDSEEFSLPDTHILQILM